MNMYFGTIDARNNAVYRNNFVADIDTDFTDEERDALLRGEKIPSYVNDDGEVEEYVFCSDFAIYGNNEY